MHLDELRARLRAMQAPRLDDVAALALPCLALHSRHPTGGSRTRLGGLPELPIGQPWPRSAAGTPMTFVGQLDLAELSSTPLAGELPGRGILGWFYDTQATSERPEFATTFAVDPDATHRAEAPDGTELVAAREVTMRPAWSLPPSNCDAFLHRFDDQADRNAYGEFRDEWDLDDEPHGHRLFGYASALDDPYVGTALDVDPSLHERWFALSVAERAQKRGGGSRRTHGGGLQVSTVRNVLGARHGLGRRRLAVVPVSSRRVAGGQVPPGRSLSRSCSLVSAFVALSSKGRTPPTDKVVKT